MAIQVNRYNESQKYGSETSGSFIEDRDPNIFIGIDLPFRKSSGVDGYFTSTSTTIDAVKNNIKNLLQTKRGERFMQPNLGMSYHDMLFEQKTESTVEMIKLDIIDTFKMWMPFVTVKDVTVKYEETTSNTNDLYLGLVFVINRDPTTLHSIDIKLGE